MACTEIVCGTGGFSGPKPGDPDNNSVLSAVGVSGGINVSWTYPTTNPYAVAYVEVYRGKFPTYSLSLKQATIAGDFYFDRIAPDDIQEYFYWIRIVSVNGTIGEVIGPVSATPAASINEVLSQLSGTLDMSYFSESVQTQLNKVSILEGTIGEEITNRLTQDAVMGEALVAVQSETGQALTYIQEEITQRVSAQEALLDSVNSLAVGMHDNAAALAEEKLLRADADSALALNVESMQTTVGEHTASIQTTMATVNGLAAQYTVKIDNNGYVSGFGLASTPANGAPYSEFAVQANAFKFGAPDGTKTPFSIVDVGGGAYKTLLNSDVLIGGNVNIANLNSGSLANDVKLSLGGGVIDLDGSGEIRVYKDLQENADFVKLSSGELRFMRFVNGEYQTYNYLSRLETGIANSGDTVTIPGYWRTQPRVMVSPAMLNLYKKDYGNQDQAIYCQALNIRETSPGSGQWVFDAKATLSLAASSGGMALNVSSGTIANNSFTTTTQTTPANCTSITPTFSLSSSRGNGSSQYYRRSVRWRVQYLNGTWVNGPWNTVAIGDQLGSVTASGTFTFPSSAAWQWRVEYEAFDSDGTVFGAISYTYTQSTCPASSGGSGTASWNSPVNLSIPFSVTGSGEIYKIDYVYAITVGMTYYSIPSEVTAHVFDLLHPTYNPNPHYAFWLSSANSLLRPLTRRISETQTVTGNNLTVSNLPFRIERMQGTDQYANVTANVAAADCYAVVYRRQIVSNSTTPSNSFILNSFSYSLTAAQVLATGSMNWIAIGE